MAKFNKYLILLTLVVAFIGTFFIDYQIKSHNMLYYHGKDNGLIVRLEWVCLISCICYILLAKKHKLIFALLGLIVGFLSLTISYFLIYFTNLQDIYYHLLSIVMLIVSIFLIKLKNNYK